MFKIAQAGKGCLGKVNLAGLKQALIGAAIRDKDDNCLAASLDLKLCAKGIVPGGTGEAGGIEGLAIGHWLSGAFPAVPRRR